MLIDKQEIMVICAAVVSALYETDNTPAPESMFYIVCKMDMELWTAVRDILIKAHMIQIKFHLVSLTPDGIQTAMRLEKAMKK